MQARSLMPCGQPLHASAGAGTRKRIQETPVVAFLLRLSKLAMQRSQRHSEVASVRRSPGVAVCGTGQGIKGTRGGKARGEATQQTRTQQHITFETVPTPALSMPPPAPLIEKESLAARCARRGLCGFSWGGSRVGSLRAPGLVSYFPLPSHNLPSLPSSCPRPVRVDDQAIAAWCHTIS